jgi:hypothetical protein
MRVMTNEKHPIPPPQPTRPPKTGRDGPDTTTATATATRSPQARRSPCCGTLSFVPSFPCRFALLPVSPALLLEARPRRAGVDPTIDSVAPSLEPRVSQPLCSVALRRPRQVSRCPPLPWLGNDCSPRYRRRHPIRTKTQACAAAQTHAVQHVLLKLCAWRAA